MQAIQIRDILEKIIHENDETGFDEIVPNIVEAIEESAKTGTIEDGKIFISTVEETIRIRTGKRGKDAI